MERSVDSVRTSGWRAVGDRLFEVFATIFPEWFDPEEVEKILAMLSIEPQEEPFRVALIPSDVAGRHRASTGASVQKLFFRERLQELRGALGAARADSLHLIASEIQGVIYAFLDQDVDSFESTLETFEAVCENAGHHHEDQFELIRDVVVTLRPDEEVELLWAPSEERILIPEPVLIALPTSLLSAVRRSPELLFGLSGRDFEKLVADVFASNGFEVTLTAQTRDGGKDIVAVLRKLGLPFKVVVECKRYARHRRVGVAVVQRLFGVARAEQAHRGIVVTTSSFSGDARQFADQHQVDLRDYEGLLDWIGPSRS